MHKGSEKKEKRSIVFSSMILHCVIGILASSLMAILFSLLIFYEKIDLSSAGALSYASVFFGSAIASILSCVKYGKNLLIAGAQALIFLTICYLIGTFLNSRVLLSQNPIALVCVCLSGTILGAIIVAMSKKTRRYK